jgi:hypothetical protein
MGVYVVANNQERLLALGEVLRIFYFLFLFSPVLRSVLKRPQYSGCVCVCACMRACVCVCVYVCVYVCV